LVVTEVFNSMLEIGNPAVSVTIGALACEVTVLVVSGA
jgi:hypothetical protein